MNCYHCGSMQTRKHGKTGNGKQRYKCRADAVSGRTPARWAIRKGKKSKFYGPIGNAPPCGD